MGLEQVKATVLAEARTRAEETIQQARQEAAAILAEGVALDQRQADEVVREARLRVERETVRELERIQHDNRLEILAAKNKAIDTVFERIADRLSAMPGTDYVALVGKWLAALPADAGGVLRVNPKDAETFSSGLTTLNAGRSGAGIFTAVEADPKIPNGVVVDGPDYTIDCTIDRRLNELRESSAGDLARVLFGA